MPLSPREAEILRLVAAGQTTKEVAAALSVAASTIDWHIAHIFVKLEASSRAEAVGIAVREGLLQSASESPAASPPRAVTARRRARMRRDDSGDRRYARLVDVLDRVLDKGIVIEGRADISIGGIQLITVEARVVVVSMEQAERAARASGALPSQAVAAAVEHYLQGLRPNGRAEK